MDSTRKLLQGNISKSELALHYFRNVSPSSALKSFMRMLNRDKDLMNRLCRETRYHKHAHTLNPRQVELILDKLGEPRRDKLFDSRNKP